MCNFVSIDEAVAFFFARGFACIHYMGEGRIMHRYDKFLDENEFMHIRLMEEEGVIAYEITDNQLQEMLDRRLAA